jgi:hypothetical protein
VRRRGFAKAVLSDGTVFCQAESKSWRYARTKATKLALNMLATPFRKEMLSNAEYQARVLAREEEKMAKRKAEIEARDAAKEALREEKNAKRKEIAQAIKGLLEKGFVTSNLGVYEVYDKFFSMWLRKDQ